MTDIEQVNDDDRTILIWTRRTYSNSDKPIEPAQWNATGWTIRLMANEFAEMSHTNGKYELTTDMFGCDNGECGSDVVIAYYPTREMAEVTAPRIQNGLDGVPDQVPAATDDYLSSVISDAQELIRADIARKG